MNDIVYQAGDLVEVILDKKSMKFDRYKTSNHIEGLAIVTGGPHESPNIPDTYTIRLQTLEKTIVVSGSVLRLVSPRKD